jgi:MFS transporter, DHA1 family, inner membrane transport protein
MHDLAASDPPGHPAAELPGSGGDLAASLGASAANAGIATGALVGGQVVAGRGVREVALAGALILLLALPATIAARSLRPRAVVTAAAPISSK